MKNIDLTEEEYDSSYIGLIDKALESLDFTEKFFRAMPFDPLASGIDLRAIRVALQEARIALEGT